MHTSPVDIPPVSINGYKLTERICESFPHLLLRGQRLEDNIPVVIKTLQGKYPTREDLAEIRREYQLTLKLQTEGIIKLYDLVSYGQGNLAMIIEPFGTTLEKFLQSLPSKCISPSKFLPIAINLTKILNKVHAARVIHKDVNPSNILIDTKSLELRLIDFGLSSELVLEHQNSLKLDERIEGSLPYISPEQTGRMNRDIDYRSDYYSLGITFYQMLSGQRPFNADTPLEWVYCHIGKQAPELHQINKNIPKSLSEIIGKLLAKNAEDRYQTAHGIIHDLRTVLQNIKSGKTDDLFIIGKTDVSSVFHLPQKLYGREQDMEIIESCFERTVQGSLEFCLISGYSGIGKTALVNELSRTLVAKQGYLIQGKFEQFKHNSAYVALAKAFRELIRQLLGEPKNNLDVWSSALREALGNNAQLLIDIIPELELLIGLQSPVPDLPPAEAQSRFQHLFINFVNVFAKSEHPFLIFLDDLQWCDLPTLNLMQRIVTSHELSHLLLIGTYRDNEVDTAHPLNLRLEEIKKKRDIIELYIKPLDYNATSRLVNDTLLNDQKKTSELVEIIHEKSGGNPFFAIELLKNLHDRTIIYFNSELNRWDWDIDKVKSVNYSQNVIDILIAVQERLKPDTREILKVASAIGATFHLKTLAIIRKSSLQKTAMELLDAVAANLISPLDESYKYLAFENDESADNIDFIQKLDPTFRFLHDRIQQAAYSKLSKKEQQELHLKIGKLLVQHCNENELEERLVEVVGHLNAGRKLLKNEVDCIECATLNLRAGIKVKQSSAYHEALHYLNICHEMFNEQAWDSHYDLIWKSGIEIQHCFYLTGDLKNANQWTDRLLEKSKTSIQKGLVLAARTRQFATIGRMKASTQAAYQGLEFLGFHFSDNPGKKEIADELAKIENNLKGRSISSLIEMSEMTDDKAKIASQLIMEIFAAAYLSGIGEMFPYLVLKSVNLALEYGNSPETAFAYAAYGMVLCGYFEDTDTGFEYGNLAIALNERLDDIALRSRIIYLYAMFIYHWSNHWSGMTPWFRKGIEAGYQSGDLLYLAYSAQDCIIWDPKLDIETAIREHKRFLTIVKDCDYQDSLDSGTLFLQMQLNFQGLTKNKFSLSDDSFSEEVCLTRMRERSFMTGLCNYHLYKAEIYLMYNDAGSALKHVLEYEKLLTSVMALPQMVRTQIVAFLVRSTILHEVNDNETVANKLAMQQNLEHMSRWAEHCKENFEHLKLLMLAEIETHKNNVEEALLLFEKAIKAANLSGYKRDEAMANEFAGIFLLKRGILKAAEVYIQEAHYIYYQWGAHRKVQDLESKYKNIYSLNFYQNDVSGRTSDLNISNKYSSSIKTEMLDVSSVIKASQTISGLLDLDNLLISTLKVLMENAGAQRGVVVEHRNGKLHLLAGIDENGKESLYNKYSDINTEQIIPETIITAAIRTKESIVIANASETNAYLNNTYIKVNKPISVMCVPLPTYGHTVTALYFENNLAHSVFTDERVKIVKLLASQAAISLENAYIYQEQKKLLHAQQRFVPTQFLEHLGHIDIATVQLGESVGLNMSVLFSDIRDFTPLVEKLTPQSVIELLNRYFSVIGEPILQTGGFIDSYAGDALMALFPVPAQQAVMAGIKMAEILREFNKKSDQKNVPKLKIGIGLNTGPLVLGTMGGSERMQCTVLGDTVNLASRIEQLTKYYGAQFLISESTLNMLDNPEEFSIRLVDRVAVKGKGMAVRLYEILDAEDKHIRKTKEATIDLLNQAFLAYNSRDFELAGEIIKSALFIDPKDNVLKLMASRIDRYKTVPPAEDWQGYEKLGHK